MLALLLVGLVVGDPERSRFEVVPRKPDERNLKGPEVESGLEARNACDHLARPFPDDRLLPADAADRHRHVRDPVLSEYSNVR